MNKKEIKAELEKKLEKKKKSLIAPRADGVKSSRGEDGGDSGEVSETLVEEKISPKIMSDIKKMKKKKMSDEEIMLEIDKNHRVNQKEMNAVARFLMDED